ncbi:BTAD domain-containing putative transcriptional regulator [Actinophytocola algeriensis]|uniref:Putative ATPase/DNA-binding SARP family transcriptional activator n=1 Tax=Actinophytocola algeriensis TaxID=1768010 RepID=A0A7W7QD96_9PSEU|nr:BTAD domain-containing putative transcriptional regulator [Actinophytocola algeriensis]MBB4911288.1 putative ATPase/DNA-binding SARP family transcriptional activator [Actinophytocola algeriensis]MBE1479227.1 putative ATPase/DNA-binding SARP family transcriptional activator [Actinophytocola algeriensis]
MRFGLLGPLAVWTDHGEPVTVPGRKVRALLANLLVNAGRPVSADRLVDDLWGAAAPADPTAALHVRVSQLRRALANAEPGGRELVVSQAPGYTLRTDALDATRFAALVDQAQAAGDPRARAALLTEALSLWRGPVLADFADDEFTDAARTRWEERRLATVEAHAEARLELGEHHELVSELGEHVVSHPYRERLRAAHMRALHRAGRTSEALDSFQDLRGRLGGELGLDPGPELTALHQAVLSGDPAEDAPPPAPRPVTPATNLPAPLTELIGRDHAIARVRELLAAGRLVTLTGPGGVGKTSVAVAVALAETYPDGAWLVDLTTWDGAGDLTELVLSALSIPGTQQLATTLRERRMLLVLDNCEHVLEPVADLVGPLLPAAPGVRVLATSREPLRLRGEVRFDLPPLDVPDTDDPERLAHSAAVRLFLARAGLTASPEITTGVAEVCRRLDGIPLALELAATRVPALGVPELAARLQVPHDRFGLLGSGPRDAPARQRTLAAVIDWSWRLLTDDERTVLRRLAVHVGGCTLAAAEAVCAVDEVLDLLSGLVDRSLVARVDGSRYRLLESVSVYCLDRLRDAGEEDAVRRRHADHYLALAEQADLHGPAQREWLRVLDAEAANMRAALDTFRRSSTPVQALRLTTSLGWHWLLRGRLIEGQRMLSSALEVAGDAPAEVRATAEYWHTGLAIRQGKAGPELAAEALRAYEKVATPVELARAEWFLASAIVDFGDTVMTGELLERALQRFREAGDRWGEAAVLSIRAMLAHMRGDVAALEADARRGAELFGALGDDWGVLQATEWLIGLADMTGDHAEATRLAREGLRIAEELGLWSDVAGRLSWLAWIAVQTTDYAAAQEYASQARRLTIEQGQRVAEVFATISLAFAARRAGNLDVAEEHLRWLLSSARDQQGDESAPPYLPMVLLELGLLAEQRGDTAGALKWHSEAFDVSQDVPPAVAGALEGMAAALTLDGRAELAARFLGAAARVRRESGHPLSTPDRGELDRITSAVQLADPDFDAHFASGAELTPSAARSYLGT